MSIVSGTIGAIKGSKATEQAAQTAADASRYIFDEIKRLNEPFYNQGLASLPSIRSYTEANLPSFEDIVYKPMSDWKYQQSPAYQAKYTLASEELNNQLQARGLTPSAIGANRATDLSRRLTADDYATERGYEYGRRTDLYKGKLSENTDRYNRLLDQVKMAQGAAGTMGQAGNQYAQGVGQAAMEAGQAKAGFWSGLGGASAQTAATGLRAYDYGNKAGWWGQGANSAGVTAAGAGAAATAYAPEMAADYGALYGL